jgi:purine-nucleoside phosphorylase
VADLSERLGGRRPKVLLVLGSGLGPLAEEVSDPLVIAFEEVGLPPTSVPGHAGRLLAGTLGGVELLVQQGRLHLYEGHDATQVTACVRLAAQAGIGTLIVTNAAGGLRPDLQVGDLLLITDHMNLTATSPLIGHPPIGQPPFVDMGGAYDPHLRAQAQKAAALVGERLVEGVYAGVVGPAYETPAEIRMLRALGADAVGMSTVLEVIAARALGMRVLGCSLITNVHQPHATEVDHTKVLAQAIASGPRLGTVIRTVLPWFA